MLRISQISHVPPFYKLISEEILIKGEKSAFQISTSRFYKKLPITGFEAFADKDDYFCFHAGTKFDENGNIVTNGGRVLGISALGSDLKEARAKAYEATEWITFANKYMRHDIGKAIDEA